MSCECTLVPLNDASFAAATITYTGAAGVTATFPPGPRAVWVVCTTAAYVRVGEGVTATTADLYLAANVPQKIAVPLGSGAPWRVSAIQVATGGSVYAKPLQG